MKWPDGNTNTMTMNLAKLQEMMRNREACHAWSRGAAKRQTQLGD